MRFPGVLAVLIPALVAVTIASAEDRAGMAANVELLQSYGIQTELLSADDVNQFDTYFSDSTSSVGGLFVDLEQDQHIAFMFLRRS